MLSRYSFGFSDSFVWIGFVSSVSFTTFKLAKTYHIPIAWKQVFINLKLITSQKKDPEGRSGSRAEDFFFEHFDMLFGSLKV